MLSLGKTIGFVFLQEDLSLRRLVAGVETELGPDYEGWQAWYALVRMPGEYRCIGLPHLSMLLTQREWTLDTPVTAFDLVPCQVREKEGRPVDLLPVTLRLATVGSEEGWWGLVGAYMAEQGRVPEWQERLPDEFRRLPVIHLDPRTTLGELARRMRHTPADEERVLATQDPQTRRWLACTVDEFVEWARNRQPEPGASAEIGTLLAELASTKVQVRDRATTPWKLVQELLPESSLTRLLMVLDDLPLEVLGRRVVMRTSDGAAPKTPVAQSLAASAQQVSAFWVRLAEAEPGERDRGRVVNSWFAHSAQEAVSHCRALAANQRYLLGVNVGSPDARAYVPGGQPEISARLVQYAVGQGKPLTVRVDSEDFWVLDDAGRQVEYGEQQVCLPAEGTTGDLWFLLHSPVRTGLCGLRLSVYIENNLVQSYRIYAHIAPGEGEMPIGVDGWWNECEYTLSADFTDLDKLRPRRVCIWVGEGRQETQRIGIGGLQGLDLGPLPPLNVGLIEAALERYRDILVQSCYYETKSGRAVYLYDPQDHAPVDGQTFEQTIKALAELGQMLYQRVFGEQNARPIAARLHDIEQAEAGPLTVQIARLTLDMAFPWAVLYDRPLRYHTQRNVVCTRFAHQDMCRADCPHAGDENVICPYGFWGYRYIVEQPLRPPRSFASVVTDLQAESHPRLALVYGARLGLAQDHMCQVTRIVGERADAALYGALVPAGQGTTEDLLRDLEQGISISYFYCHGGNKPYRQWLVLRDDDPLMPSYLGEELRAAWEKPGAAPLVVLNGCHTAKYTPSSFLSFVHRFASLGAAGVVGTEVPIHEHLARYLGEFLIARLLEGQSVGRIVYDFRNALLKKQNPLGLVYVPYCYADLHLVSEQA
jgi:hypothetical protein